MQTGITSMEKKEKRLHVQPLKPQISKSRSGVPRPSVKKCETLQNVDRIHPDLHHRGGASEKGSEMSSASETSTIFSDISCRCEDSSLCNKLSLFYTDHLTAHPHDWTVLEREHDQMKGGERDFWNILMPQEKVTYLSIWTFKHVECLIYMWRLCAEVESAMSKTQVVAHPFKTMLSGHFDQFLRYESLP